MAEKVPTGIPGLDELIGGGFEGRAVNLLCGAAGTGKTTLALQFLYNGAVQYGEPGVFISFSESKEQLFEHALSFNINLKEIEEQGLFKVVRYEPHEVAKLVEEGGGTVRDLVDSMGAKRIAIDPLTSYALLFDSKYKMRESMLELFTVLRSWECTCIVTSDMGTSSELQSSSGAEFIVDGVIVLHHPRAEGERFRALEILKMRGTKHSEKLVPFQFEENGIVVYPSESVFQEVE